MPRGRKAQPEKIDKAKREDPAVEKQEDTVPEVEEKTAQREEKPSSTVEEQIKEVAIENSETTNKANEGETKQSQDNWNSQNKEEPLIEKGEKKNEVEESTSGWGAVESTVDNSTGGWGAPVENSQPQPQKPTPVEKEKSSGGWGAPAESSLPKKEQSTGGWGEPLAGGASTGGWGAPEIQSEPVRQTNKSTMSSSKGGWGAPEFATESNSSAWKHSDVDIGSRGQDSSYQQSSNSYKGREPRRNDSYGQQGGYSGEQRGRSFDRPQRDGFQREQRQYDRFGSNDRSRSGPPRGDSYRDDSYPPRDGGYGRKRYDNSDSYNRDDKRARYDERQDNYNSRPQEDHYSRGRNDSQYGQSREDRYGSRPPQDDYERGRGRDYDRGASYESRGDNDKPYEPRVPRERKPFPSNVSPSKAIGIFGLSIHATENDLREFLSEELSDISDYKITIVHDRNTGTSKGYGFVYFQCLEDSISAKERLVGKSIKGKEIRVDFSISDALRPSYR